MMLSDLPRSTVCAARSTDRAAQSVDHAARSTLTGRQRSAIDRLLRDLASSDLPIAQRYGPMAHNNYMCQYWANHGISELTFVGP